MARPGYGAWHGLDAAAGGQAASWSVGGSGAWSGLSVGYGYTSGQRSSRATSLGGIALPAAGYTYDSSSGRMASVSSSDFTATYRYNSGTGWNEGVTYSSGLSSTRTPDAQGRLDAITWSSGGSVVSAHDYTLDAMNRRTAAQRQDGSAWGYGYNSRGEVTSAGKAGEPGKQFAFAYDGMGNRTSSSVSSIADSSVLRSTSYSANALNQYESITHPSPGWMVLRGSVNATPGVTVTVDGNPPTQRSGTLWNHEQSVDNSAGPVRREVTISATRPDGGRKGGPVTTQQKGSLFIPPASEVPTYDQDGNQISDARWIYVWDGENRLIAMEEKPGFTVQPTSSAPVKRTRLEFAYDAQGRRITKRVLSATGSSGFVLQQAITHLYDGWNMIGEIDTTTSAQLLRSYEWGMDISGTLTGAGGVGGLLIERFHAPSSPSPHLPPSGAHAPCYDGNGNVTELVNLATASISARYEYGAFGETISMDGGAVATANPFRFSTKYVDAETGLYNYGYRYYDAGNGRWLNRDPIKERGGINLYGMVGNDPVNRWDYLGLQCCFSIKVFRIGGSKPIGTLSNIVAYCNGQQVWTGVGREPPPGSPTLQPLGERNTALKLDGKWGPDFVIPGDDGPRSPVFNFNGGAYQLHTIPWGSDTNWGDTGKDQNGQPDGTRSRSLDEYNLSTTDQIGEGCTWVAAGFRIDPDGKGGANLWMEGSRNAMRSLVAAYRACCPKGGSFKTKYISNPSGWLPANFLLQYFPKGIQGIPFGDPVDPVTKD